MSSARETTGAHAIWRALTDEGVDVVFGYPGGAIMPAYDAMPDHPVRHVLCRHEQNAAHMADGYARASGRVGVAIATSGPGATNLVTGIATAMLDSSPIVCITGQVPSTLIGTDAFQETDITGVTLPITKHNYLVTRAEDIAPTIREAFLVARSGRPGPVVVDITKDAQLGRCGTEPRPAKIRRRRRRPLPALSDESLARAAELIVDAQRPLVFCGHGVVKAGASALLEMLVDRASLPVACTLLGLGGFPGTHPRCLGMMGMHGEAWVNEAVQRADLIVALGMRFDDRVTGNLATYARGAKKIHVELDPAEINKIVEVELPIVADVGAFLERLVPRIDASRIDEDTRAAWRAELTDLREDARPHDVLHHPGDDRLLGAHVIADLYDLTAGDALIVSDVGQHQMWEAQYYRHDRPRSLLTSGGLGTMGFGLPAAVGARFARPAEEIWVVVGDGGFQMSAPELSTCLQEGVRLNVAIINNGYLGMVRQWQEIFFERRYVATPIGGPDFVKLAEAHGLRGMRVECRAQIPEAVAFARGDAGTTVIDFRVEAEEIVYPMVPAGNDLADMLRRPRGGSPQAGSKSS